MPEKSRPGVRGRVVASKLPESFLNVAWIDDSRFDLNECYSPVVRDRLLWSIPYRRAGALHANPTDFVEHGPVLLKYFYQRGSNPETAVGAG
jgi:hypothetical protein